MENFEKLISEIHLSKEIEMDINSWKKDLKNTMT
jgi:hypothetical protein